MSAIEKDSVNNALERLEENLLDLIYDEFQHRILRRNIKQVESIFSDFSGVREYTQNIQISLSGRNDPQALTNAIHRLIGHIELYIHNHLEHPSFQRLVTTEFESS